MGKIESTGAWLLALGTAAVLGCSGAQRTTATPPPLAGNPASAPYAPRLHGQAPQPTATEGLHAAVTQNPVSKALRDARQSTADWFKTQPPSVDQHDPVSLSSDAQQPGADLYLAAARVQVTNGNLEQAMHQYERALQVAPRNLPALLGTARLLDRQGDLQAATTYYQRAVEYHPREAAALNDLALCYARQGMLEKSHQVLLQAIEVQPQRALYRNNIAKVLVNLGRTDQAMVHLAKVHPRPVAHYNLGYLLHQRGMHDQAAAEFAKAIELDPTMEPARAWLARVTVRPAAFLADIDQATVAAGSAEAKQQEPPEPAAASSLRKSRPIKASAARPAGNKQPHGTFSVKTLGYQKTSRKSPRASESHPIAGPKQLPFAAGGEVGSAMPLHDSSWKADAEPTVMCYVSDAGAVEDPAATSDAPATGRGLAIAPGAAAQNASHTTAAAPEPPLPSLPGDRPGSLAIATRADLRADAESLYQAKSSPELEAASDKTDAPLIQLAAPPRFPELIRNDQAQDAPLPLR